MKSNKKLILMALTGMLALPLAASQQAGPRVSKFPLLALGGAAAVGLGYLYHRYCENRNNIQREFEKAIWDCAPITEIKRLLKLKPDVNAIIYGEPLLEVAWSKLVGSDNAVYRYDLMRILLQAGVNTKVSSKILAKEVTGNNVEIVRLLLDHGADIHTKTGMLSINLLDAAIIERKPEVARLLVKRGASFSENFNKNKEFWFAIYGCQCECVCILLDQGADICATNENGETAHAFVTRLLDALTSGEYLKETNYFYNKFHNHEGKVNSRYIQYYQQELPKLQAMLQSYQDKARAVIQT